MISTNKHNIILTLIGCTALSMNTIIAMHKIPHCITVENHLSQPIVIGPQFNFTKHQIQIGVQEIGTISVNPQGKKAYITISIPNHEPSSIDLGIKKQKAYLIVSPHPSTVILHKNKLLAGAYAIKKKESKL